MAKSFVETILGATAGTTVTVKPDRIIVNDGVSSTVTDRVSKTALPDRIAVVYDHDVPTGSSESAAVFIKIKNFAQKFGFEFIQGKGIAYQYFLDERIKAGEVIVSGGSHTSIFGAKGALGINLAVDELVAVIETGTLTLKVPQTLCVGLEKKLPENYGAMDAAFCFLSMHKDIEGKALEFLGSGLSASDRAVFCSMASMTGALSAIFTDTAQADEKFDLSTVKPMIMLPCEKREDQSKAEIKRLVNLAGTTVHAGQIGGYTAGTIEGLRQTAALIDGKHLALGFRLSICPATSRDYLMMLEEGLIEKFLDYGAQVHAVGDRSVVVQGPGTVDAYESLITTGLYTFDGCMGTRGSKVYSAGIAAVVAASATKTIEEV